MWWAKRVRTYRHRASAAVVHEDDDGVGVVVEVGREGGLDLRLLVVGQAVLEVLLDLLGLGGRHADAVTLGEVGSAAEDGLGHGIGKGGKRRRRNGEEGAHLCCKGVLRRKLRWWTKRRCCG